MNSVRLAKCARACSRTIALEKMPSIGTAGVCTHPSSVRATTLHMAHSSRECPVRPSVRNATLDHVREDRDSRPIGRDGQARGFRGMSSMRSNDVEQTAKTVHRLDNLFDEDRIQTVALGKLPHGDF